MRKLFFIAAVAILATACGSSKQVATTAQVNPYASNQETTTPKRVKLEDDECKITATTKSEFVRGYGIATSADQMMAYNEAAATARNKILNQISVSASNYLNKYNLKHGSSAAGEGMKREAKGKYEESIKSVADEMLNGAREICSNAYMVGNEYEVHICVELTNVDYSTKIYNKLANDEKLLIDFSAEKFKEGMDKELEAYRKRKQGI